MQKLKSILLKDLSKTVIIGIASVSLLTCVCSFAVSGIKFLNYSKQYEKEAAELKASFPALPEKVMLDNDFVTYDEEGSEVVKSKSKYKKSFTYYARDAVVAPLSQDVAAEIKKDNDTYLGEYITGLDRRGGAISFYIRTPNYGMSDIDIALATNWVDEKNEYHEMENITDYIKIQINGLEVKTESASLPSDQSYQHLVLKNTHLLKGENVLTFTTSAYNTFGNKDDILYIMPNIRAVTVLTDVNIYTPIYDFDTSNFSTSYRLIDTIDLSTISVTKEIGEDGICYVKEEMDIRKLRKEIDYENDKLIIFCSPKDIKEIPLDIDRSASSNTIKGTIDEKEVTIVVKSNNLATVTSEGKSCDVNISLTGDSGFATINILSKESGDDATFALLPTSVGIEEKGGELNICLVKYYVSTTKANANTQNGVSQTGYTYFAIGPDKSYVVAFWIWSYSGRGNLEMRCKYTLSGTTLTLTDVIEQKLTEDGKAPASTSEWQYLSSKTFTVSECSVSDLPFIPTYK